MPLPFSLRAQAVLGALVPSAGWQDVRWEGEEGQGGWGTWMGVGKKEVRGQRGPVCHAHLTLALLKPPLLAMKH